MKIRKLLLTVCILFMAMPFSVNAALLQLSNTPLFAGGQVPANVFFTLDDSGSMVEEAMISPYWQDCAYDAFADGSNTPKDSNCGVLVTNSNLYFYYSGRSSQTSSMIEYLGILRSCEQNPSQCPAGRKDWRGLSNDFNTLYYKPGVNYQHWYGVCSKADAACTPANFNAAKHHPYSGTGGSSDQTDLAGFSYIVWIDDKGFSGSRPYQGSALNVTSTANEIVDLWDSHIKITINNNNVLVYAVNYAPFYTTNTNQGIGETATLKATLTNTTACYNVLGNSTLVRSIAAGSATYTSQDSAGCQSITDLRQNYANWFQYHRNRFYTAQNAIGSIVENNPQYRYGLGVLNQWNSLFVSVPEKDDTASLLTHKKLLQKNLNRHVPVGDTPLRLGLVRTGSYFQGKLTGKGNPIAYACQQNFNILITDGYWTDNGPLNSNKILDQDGDGIPMTLADIASYYYETDLSSLPNTVAPNPNDSATHQHLVTFTVGFGVTGNLVDTDGDGWPNPSLTKNSVWGGDPFTNEPAKVDDLWHSAFNSRGAFLSAQSPETLVSTLSSTLSSINDRMGSASSAAQNSTLLNKDSYVYQARFSNKLWYGELLAYPVNLDGTVGTIATWNAHCIFNGGICSDSTAAKNPIDANKRVIITKDWSKVGGDGIPFRWPSNYVNLSSAGILPQAIKNYLKLAPYAATTTQSTEIIANQNYGTALINYLRGDTTYDGSFLGTVGFRQRYGLLGDIVNSGPIYIGKPDRYYPDLLMPTHYTPFKTTYEKRTPMIGFGANDGMYHLLNANTGEELLAYVPGESRLISNLGTYAQPSYTHRFYVDGFSHSGDVYFNGAWHTIVLGGLRQGGQGIFALDVTDPSQFSESNAEKILLWEFTDQDDKDLGYTYSQFQISLINHNGTKRWAAIFGNGYNNTESDTSTSTTGKAALYIVFIDGGLDGVWTEGTDYIKLTVGSENTSTPNGLATPYPIDINQDYVVDYVYAGDLNGQIWKFNLTNSAPSTWAGTAFFQATQSIAGDQKITTMPIVGPHPNGIESGVLVYFGTGKFLEPSDNTATDAVTQTFYAVLDKLDGTLPLKTQLLQQEIAQEVTASYDTDNDTINDFDYQLRVTTKQEIDWSQHQGWYLNLSFAGTNHGERVIYAPILRKGHIIFTTLIPNESPCGYGGSSWLMELDAYSGARLDGSPFDLNKDGAIDDNDLISVTGLNNPGEVSDTTVSGMQSSVGITATPTVFNMENSTNETKVISGSNGIDSFIENGANVQDGRKTWRQLQ